ncbi:MAG: sigma-70 family RNA polymerase sigma factor [Armatimonadota bacterium]|jgi:RNA polymerase sigma factor (sigma-70 family)
MHDADLELLGRYADGRDAEAFAELVARHRDMVYAACYRVLASRADAEDSTQDCFLSLARDAGSVRTSVAGWLHRVAVRTSMAARRRDRTRRKTEREAATAMADGSPETSWDDIKTEVDQAIDGLPDKLREPLVLHFLEGKPQTAVAEELGLSQPSVSRRVRDGVERLRGRLKQTGLVVSAGGLAGLLATHTSEAAPAALVAELGKIALVGVGSGSAPAAVGGSAIGLGALASAKGKIVCLAAAALATTAVVQHAVRRPAVSGESATGPATVRAGQPLRGARAEPAPVVPTPNADGAETTLRATAPSPGHRQRPGPPGATAIAQAPDPGGAAESKAATGRAMDLTDPAAVVRAYTDACARGDLNAALALTDLNEDMHEILGVVVARMSEWPTESHGLRTVATEMALLPHGLPLSYAVAKGPVEGDTVRVAATPTAIQELAFVLRQQDDGAWRIDLEQSLLTATQQETSFVLSQAREARHRAQAARVQKIDWRVREMLYRVTRYLMDYARETGRFPPAESWMDDLEAHYLDRALLYVADVLGENYGLALNANIAGHPYPRDREEDRRWMVALYVSADTSRNAAGDPDAELAALGEDRPGLGACLASEDVVTIPRGMSVQEALVSLESGRLSRECLGVVVRALLQYARDNEGRLPPAESWWDDALLYVPPDQAAQVPFWSTAAPDLEYPWAMNEELAGKDIRAIGRHDGYVLLLPAEAGVPNEVRAVPEEVERGLFIISWADGARLAVPVGMLDGRTRTVLEGDAYPRPSVPAL